MVDIILTLGLIVLTAASILYIVACDHLQTSDAVAASDSTQRTR